MEQGSGVECPLCGRSIRPSQMRCACGNVLRELKPQAAAARNSGPTIEYGAIALWVPVGAVILMLFFVLFANPAHYPGTRLFKIVSITFLLSALLAALESERLKDRAWNMPETPFSGLTPASWFIAMLFGWPVTFPAFFYVHYLHHDETRMKRAWAAAGAFVFMLLLCWTVVIFRGPKWSAGKTSPGPSANRLPPAASKPAPDPVIVPVAVQPVTSPTLSTSTLTAAGETSQPMQWFPFSEAPVPVESTPAATPTPGPGKESGERAEFGISMPKKPGRNR
jgi:hypothetical protein